MLIMGVEGALENSIYMFVFSEYKIHIHSFKQKEKSEIMIKEIVYISSRKNYIFSFPFPPPFAANSLISKFH